jgi:lipid-A-disaccharide synthase
MNARPVKIALVAGEASGDLLGAGLIGALRERYPQAEFAGIGGPCMVEAGLDSWWPAERLAVMGLFEVLRHLPALLSLRRALVSRVLEWRPDVFVGVDAPDFNLGVERRLKRRGIRTVHYVSPSVWAWREGRAESIGRSADRVLCLFPMEPAIYARHGVEARFVGHPLADRMPLDPDRTGARAALGVPADAPVLALLPGSRLGEIGRLGPVFLQAAERVAARLPGLRVLAPMANAACRGLFERQLAAHGRPLPLTVLDGRAHEAMAASDVVLLASGTAALEAMLAKRPMVVAYRLSPLTAWLVRTFKLMRTGLYSLPNVLAGEQLVPELMQERAQPDALADAVLLWFAEPARRTTIESRFHAMHQALRRDADRQAAAAVAESI